MKPVLILQHLGADGPAYLETWLRRRGLAFDLRNSEAGQDFPASPDDHAALAILGGEMSANDDLPSLRRAEELIRRACELGVPVLGHCLGGQLMARALGARVIDSPAPEIGWIEAETGDSAAARGWFGTPGAKRVFQWHYEAFELPAGAERLASSASCPNQAFAIGPHLGLQFHLEADAEKLGRWSHDEGERYRAALRRHPATVQGPAALREGTERHVAAQHALADRVYARWIAGTGLGVS